MGEVRVLPLLPLREIVLFPGSMPPLLIGRKKSVCALDACSLYGNKIFLVAQKEPGEDFPKAEDLYDIGVVGSVLQVLKLPEEAMKVLVKVESRAVIKAIRDNDNYFEASIEVVENEGLIEAQDEGFSMEALKRSLVKSFENFSKLSKKVSRESFGSVLQIGDNGELADFIASHLDVKLSERQAVLGMLNVPMRMEKVLSLLEEEIGVLSTEKRIRNRIRSQMENTQRVYYLNEQLKAIQKELGDTEGSGEEISEIMELEQKIKTLNLSAEAREKAKSELKKLKMMNAMSAEATVVRNYLDWLLELPWGKRSRVKTDLLKSEEILNSNHYGIEKVKEGVLEYLAVQKRTKKVKGPILCLLGPPGVGKTSLAKSIADANGRGFIRISLGGVKDESEIRGHRRTYIGSMPGKIISAIKKSKTCNPLVLLDELDKVGSDFRGDPASALLEVLDPEQNKHFCDNYLEVEFDLSEVMFVATANGLSGVSYPLLDRMEMLRISGYTEDEKVEIAFRHVIPGVLKDNGIKKSEWCISKDAVRHLIRYYTRESGVRGLKRAIAKLVRKALRKIVCENGIDCARISVSNLHTYLGARKYSFGEVERVNLIGISTGLAYTEMGGDLLVLEAVAVPGKGEIKSTGKLGEVMKESVQAAFSYIKSRSSCFGIDPVVYSKSDIHLHVPEGAIPKDGPSAGIAICSAIVSLLTRIPVDSSVAMTGEVTLRGRVLEIGGLKEKLLAAVRGGVKTVLIPARNVKDLEDIPSNVKKTLKIMPVENVDEVLSIALTLPLVPIEVKKREKGGRKKEVPPALTSGDVNLKH